MCEENKLPFMVVYRSFKRCKKWSDCRDACNDESECQYFKWKVINRTGACILCLYLYNMISSLQNVRKWQKRTCFLMKVDYRAKNNWVSGARFCGSQ